MRRLLPSPLLSVALFIVWLLLNPSIDLPTVLLALILALFVPVLTKSLRPATARIRRPGLALKLCGAVVMDLIGSALEVARVLLTRRSRDIQSKFVTVPLDIRDPNGLAVLAMICCLTPGTAWGELSIDRTTLLIHVFDVVSKEAEDAFIAMIKTRYERPLKEIFES